MIFCAIYLTSTHFIFNLSDEHLCVGYLLWQVIARSLSPMWLRIGGTEADYVTFVPPVSTSRLSSSLNGEDDSEQGDVNDTLGFSGHSELDGGSGQWSQSYTAGGKKKMLENKDELPNPSYNGTAQEDSHVSKVHCKVED